VKVLSRSGRFDRKAMAGAMVEIRLAGCASMAVKRYRPDKSAAEADTIDDLRALHSPSSSPR
jgi:hypothetical protein